MLPLFSRKGDFCKKSPFSFIRSFLFLLPFSSFLFVLNIQAKKIILYHTSDIHGYHYARKARWYKTNPTRQVGGFAALAGLIKKEKNPFMLLDSGDWFAGTMAGNEKRGEKTVNLMNKLNYSASILGNHDYDIGKPNLDNLVSIANFDILSANLKGKYNPYKIITVDGIKIGVMGLSYASNFKSKTKVVSGYVKLLKSKTDAILLLTHSGLCRKCAGKTLYPSQIHLSSFDYARGNIRIARMLKGSIAVVLGGHNHSAFRKGYYDKVSKTLFVESGSNLKTVSKVTLEFNDESNKFISAKSKLIYLWIDKTGQDEEILKLLNSGKKDDKIITHAKNDILRLENADSSLGNLITDIMRENFDADIAFYNTLGIRSDIYKGPVSFSDIYKVLPFEGTIITVDMTGAQVEKFIKNNIKDSKTFIQASGIKISYRKRTKILKVMKNGKKINPKKIYKIAVNSYLFSKSKTGRVLRKGRNIVDTKINIRNSVTSFLSKRENIKAPKTGRINII